MLTEPNGSLTVESALKLLKDYNCLQLKTVELEIEREQLREAIKLIVSLSEYENFGICADNAQEGFTALGNYLKALFYETTLQPVFNADDKSPVYIKLNTKTMNYYLDTYNGSYRGVLISCQGENANFAGTYGHFPLDLFD